MTVDTTTLTFVLLDNIRAACTEIQHALNEHLEKTGNDQYVTYIQRDLVLLDNIKHITHAVRSDIESDKVGAGTELLLRVAANDFKNRLDLIPEKKAVVKVLVRMTMDLVMMCVDVNMH